MTEDLTKWKQIGMEDAYLLNIVINKPYTLPTNLKGRQGQKFLYPLSCHQALYRPKET
jgi:hypothetical protein